jgi:protein SCO1
VGTALNGPVPASIYKTGLVSSRGEKVSLASFGPRVLVISDSMTLCQEDCPLDTANIVSAARAADAAGLADRVEFLTITVDPGRDTPTRLTKYRRLFVPPKALPNWQLLTGSQQHIDTLWKYLGVYFKRVPEDSPPSRDWLTGRPLTYDVEHADEVIAFDARDHERFVISGHADVQSARNVPAKMREFLTRSGRRHMKNPGGQAWTPEDVLQVVEWLTGETVPSSRASG